MAETALYLITRGRYSDYAVDALLEGPADASMHDLYSAFYALEDHGFQQQVLKLDYRDPLYQKALREHRDWKKTWTWGETGFVGWLTDTQGFCAVSYREYNTDDGESYNRTIWYTVRATEVPRL